MYNPFMFNSFSFMPFMNMSFMPFMMSNLGFGLGFNLGNLGTSIFCQPRLNYAVTGGGYYQDNRSQEYALATELSNCENNIKAELKKLGNVSESEAQNYSIEPKYQEAIDTANANKENKQKRMIDVDTEIKRLMDLPEDQKKPSDDRELEKLKAEYATLERDLSEGGKYDQEIAKAEKAKEDREKEIAAAKERIAELQEERETLEGQLNYTKIDNADGNPLNRTSAKAFNKMYDLKNLKFKKGDASKIDAADMRYILMQYRTAKDEATKEQYANAFKNIYEDENLSAKVKDQYSEIYDLICG